MRKSLINYFRFRGNYHEIMASGYVIADHASVTDVPSKLVKMLLCASATCL